MRFAKVVFWCAGIWGMLILVPLYFMLGKINLQTPPAVTHPEFFYGFIGVALAWQFVFLLIATDPVRFKLIMLPAIFEKFAYSIAVFVLYSQARVHRSEWIDSIPDFILGVLFIAAYFKTPIDTQKLVPGVNSR